MSETIENLIKIPMWNFFLALEKIPRESGNEQGVRNFLLSWAKEHHIEAADDGTGNIFMWKPATEGYEESPSIALQGHMDMVCVKTEQSKHDFAHDPIEVEVEGDWLTAKDTSLGGDNGIAVAMALDILSDEKLEHGPLEAIFTYSEETGMDGAVSLDTSIMRSRKMINLDSEDDGVVFIGCAGGQHTEGTLTFHTEPVPKDWKTISLTVAGLKGGHSGGEIHTERANAIKLVARALIDCPELMISSFSGGERANVIPSSAQITFALPEEQIPDFYNSIEKLSGQIADEYRFSDPDISITLSEAEPEDEAMTEESSEKIIRTLFLIPHGVFHNSTSLKDVVETSSNLAQISMKRNLFHILTSQRSSVESRRDLAAKIIGKQMESAGFTVSYNGHYPPWTPNPDSELLEFCTRAYKDYTGEDMKVTAIHAGLECGIINSKLEGLDSISIGPQMKDIHSVNEMLSIPSSEKMLSYVKHLLSIIK